MGNVRHTPAPWKEANQGKIFGDTENEKWDGDHPLLAEIYGWDAEQQANARLIAAAPDLLEALKGLVRIVEGIRFSNLLGKNQTERFDKAMAVIAKVEAQ